MSTCLGGRTVIRRRLRERSTVALGGKDDDAKDQQQESVAVLVGHVVRDSFARRPFGIRTELGRKHDEASREHHSQL